MVAAPEFLGFILIGVGGALVAVVYMRAILYFGPNRAARARRRLVSSRCWPAPPSGSRRSRMPDILGIGKEALRFAVIEHAYAPGELALLLVAKLLATALCLGFGFAGGVLSPALLIGHPVRGLRLATVWSC